MPTQNEGGGMGNRVLQGASTVLMVTGVSLLLASGGYLAYSRIAEANFAAMRQSADFTVPAVSGPTVVAEATVIQAEDGWSGRLLDNLTDVPARAVAIPFVSQTAFPAATRIEIPKIAVDSTVTLLGTKYVNGELVWETPKFSVGHHLGTANPGENGNAVFSGHISSPISNEGNVFQRLPEVKTGDDIIVHSPAAVIRYVVTETEVVDPSHVEIMDATARPQATLITCYPDWVYSHRFVVIARPVQWDYPGGPAAGS